MKTGIHPKYYQTTVTCSCGNTFLTGSTKNEIRVEICSACHPFFTGEMKFVDTLGRVERFMKKQQAASGQLVVKKSQKKLIKKKREELEEASKPRTLREMIERLKSGQSATDQRASSEPTTSPSGH